MREVHGLSAELLGHLGPHHRVALVGYGCKQLLLRDAFASPGLNYMPPTHVDGRVRKTALHGFTAHTKRFVDAWLVRLVLRGDEDDIPGLHTRSFFHPVFEVLCHRSEFGRRHVIQVPFAHPGFAPGHEPGV